MKAIERLEGILNDRDTRIEELEEKLREFENWRRYMWTNPQTFDSDPRPNLPLPRLEIECVNQSGNWYEKIWYYRLVRKHFLGDIVFTPLGETRSSGGGAPAAGDIPFRDGAHIKHEARHFNMPAYSIVDSIIVQLATQTDPSTT